MSCEARPRSGCPAKLSTPATKKTRHNKICNIKGTLMTGFRLILTTLFITASMVGCSSNVIVDYDKSVNFSGLKSFTLLPKSAKSTEDTRLDSPLIDKRIISAIDNIMLAKGISKKDSGAEIQLTYRIDLKQEIISNDSGVSMMFGLGGSRSALGLGYSIPTSDVKSHDLGVLTIDFVSARTGELIWRGSSKHRLYDTGTPDTTDKLINEIVKEILDSYPPK